MRRLALLALTVLALAGCSNTTVTTTVATVTTTTTTTPSNAELAEQRAAAKEKAEEEKLAPILERKAREREAEEAKKPAAPAVDPAAAESAKKVVEAWKHESVEAEDSDVLSIQRHLTSLSHKCSQSIPTLAEYIEHGVEILKNEGTTETPVKLAAALDKAAPGKSTLPDCRSVLSALLVLMEKRE